MRDFERAAEIFPLGEVSACRAYACALEGFSTSCIFSSNESIAAGFATAEVYNNLGYGYFSTNLFARAVDALDEAIRLDPGLRPALYTRALAEFKAALREQRPIDPRAITDIERAIDCGPQNAYMFYDAALIYSQLDAASGEFREKVVQYLCEAARLGVAPKIIRRAFPSLVDEPRLHNALAQDVTVVHRSRTDYLADPLPFEVFPFR
jgi:tetratricopeptide (TPR) repeat protein